MRENCKSGSGGGRESGRAPSYPATAGGNPASYSTLSNSGQVRAPMQPNP